MNLFKSSLNVGFLVVLLVILSSLCLAETSEIVDLYSGDSYNFEGYNIYLLQSSSGSTLMVKVDSEMGFIDYSMSESEFSAYRSSLTNIEFSSYPSKRIGNIELSLKKICFNLNEKDCGRINDLTKTVEPSYEIRLSYYEPELDVEVTYSKDKFYLGDEFAVTTRITNNGDVDIRDLTYFQNYPVSISIEPDEDITITDEGVEFHRSFLRKGDFVSFTYRIQLTDEVSYNLKGEYTFSYDGNEFFGESPSQKLTLADIYSADLSIPGSIPMGEEFEADVFIENRAEEDLEFGLQFVNLPSDVILVDSSEFELDDGLLYYTDTLEPGESFSDTLVFMSRKEGDKVLDLRVESMYLIQNPSEVLSEKVKVLDLDAVEDDFEVELKADFEDVLEGDVVKFETFLTKGSFDLTDVYVNLSSKELGKIVLLEKNLIGKDVSYHNFLSSLDMPLVNETNEVTFDVYVEGREDGVLRNKTDSVKIKLYNLSDAFTIQRKSPKSIKQGETGVVEVSIVNNVAHAFSGVIAKDYIPEDYLYKDVLSSVVFDLQPFEEKFLYSYEIKAPYYLNESSVVKTVLIFEDYNLTLTDTLNTLVDLKEADLDISLDMEGNLFVGGRFDVSLRIENKGGLDVYKLFVDFPLSEVADQVYETGLPWISYTELLDIGEEVTFTKSYLSKVEGNSSLIEGVVGYVDEYGNEFFEEIELEDIEVDSGFNGCFIVAEKKLAQSIDTTYSSSKVPFFLEITNFCDESFIINVWDNKNYETITQMMSFFGRPKLEFKLDADSKKIVEFTEEYETNFTYSPPSVIVYRNESLGVIRTTLSNSVEEYFEIVEEEVSSSKSSKSGGGGSSGSNLDSKEVVNLDNVIEVSFVKRLGGVILGIFVVIFLMVLLMKAIKGFVSKNHEEKMDLEDIELESDDSEYMAPPALKDGLDNLETYIGVARKNGVSEIEIEHSLFNAGWNKEVIDGFMQK